MPTRRLFLRAAGAAGALAALPACAVPAAARAPGREVSPGAPPRVSRERLLAAAARPVIRRDLIPDMPLRIESAELLESGGHPLVRVRAGGAEGLAVGHPWVSAEVPRVFMGRVAPHLVGRDARDWEGVLHGLYAAQSNYKWQGLPFWTCVASAELAVLDLLGQASGRPVHALIGEAPDGAPVRDRVAVYRASGNRGNSAEAEVAFFERVLPESGARALKVRLGDRMGATDASQRRDRALVPALRRAFPDLTLYADANSSFDVPAGIEAGRLLEDHGFAIYEEPVPFDHYDETREVARALRIPVAGGEQEFSLRHLLWQIEHGVLGVVQPDAFYFGGLVRSVRAARAAAEAGIDATPHMSGGGLGFLYAAHYAAAVPNAGLYQELKRIDPTLPVEGVGADLTPRGGEVAVPAGPGLGVRYDPAFLRAARPLVC